MHTSPDYSSFESICVDLSNSCFSGYCICISLPPGHPVNVFEEFQDLLTNVTTMHTIFYIVGDSNFYLDTSSATIVTFNDGLTSFDTIQIWPLASLLDNSLIL